MHETNRSLMLLLPDLPQPLLHVHLFDIEPREPLHLAIYAAEHTREETLKHAATPRRQEFRTRLFAESVQVRIGRVRYHDVALVAHK